MLGAAEGGARWAQPHFAEDTEAVPKANKQNAENAAQHTPKTAKPRETTEP